MSNNMAPSPPSPISSSDRDEATRLLVKQRSIDKKSKSDSSIFSYKEVNAVLSLVVDENGSPAIVKALLEHDADVNFLRRTSNSFLKKILGRDQESHRNDVLLRATRTNSVSTVCLLAVRADQTLRNEALQLAMQRNHAAKTKALLDAGADAVEFHDEFQTALTNGSADLIEALLKASKGPCSNCRNAGLVKAVASGSMRNSSLLLSNGADANYNSAAALRKAITTGRADITDAIAKCARKPTPESFDSAIALAYAKLAHDLDKQYEILEICLLGGGRGVHTNETLALAAQSGLIRVRDLLLEYGASVDHQDGAAVQFAVINEQPEHLAALVQGRASPSTLAAAMRTAMARNSSAVIFKMVEVLLSAGLRGDSNSEALVSAIERMRYGSLNSQDCGLIKLLLRHGNADVNFTGGKAIQIASEAGFTGVLKLLLRYNPSTTSLNNAFLNAMKGGDVASRQEIIGMLLRAGASGHIIDEALVASTTTGNGGVALTSMLLSQSSVDYDNGKPLCNAIRTGCLEQVQTLMAGMPSSNTLISAWIEADTLQDDGFQRQVFEILLRHGVDQIRKDRSLIAAASKGRRGFEICSFLLDNQASPDYCDGASVVNAAKTLDLATLTLLAKGATSEKTFTAAFSAVSESHDWLCPEGLEVAQFLLGKMVTHGEEVDVAFCIAARSFCLDALELLENWVNHEVAFTRAFFEVTGAGNEWLSLDKLELIERLLEWGAAGEVVDLALVEALNAFCCGDSSEDLVDTLLNAEGGAGVNFENGSPVAVAARHGNIDLLEKLLSYGANDRTLALAFEVAIKSGHEEKLLLRILDSITGYQGAKLDVNCVSEDCGSPLLVCLQGYPGSVELTKRLCGIGCSLEYQIEFLTYDDEEVSMEYVTVLAWALCQTEKPIASAVIDVLIDANANPNFRTKVSKVTPLILGAKSSRGDIVRKLIGAGATVSHRDMFERSALFYASRNGDLPSVNALLTANSSVNDGSLHEAARELHSDIVAALIEGGHKLDFPSSLLEHGGRTPLQETCLKCDSTNDPLEVQGTIQHLINWTASPLQKSRGKNALFLALDNPNPVPITRALLDCVMWQHINKEENVYMEAHPKTGTRYYYSPTMYVRKGLFQGRTSESERLIRLLVDKREEPRFYAQKWAEQPEDAVGLPENIMNAEEMRREQEEERRRKEFDHELSLLRQRQTAVAKAEIERARHEEELFQKQELAQQRLEERETDHQQALAQENEKTMQRQQIGQSTHNLNVALAKKREAQELMAKQRRARFEQQQQQRMAELKVRAQAEEHNLIVDFNNRINQGRLALQAAQNEPAEMASQRKLATQQRQQRLSAAADQRKRTALIKRNTVNSRYRMGTVHEKYALEKQMMAARRNEMKLKMMEQSAEYKND